MNAYELADEAKRQVELIYLVTDESIAKQLATMLDNYAKMLRQQADRIAELEKSQMAWYEAGKFVTPQIKELSDRELVVFLMDEIDRASEWLVDGETHMAIGVLGQCHAKIRKHLSNTKESE